MRPFLMCFRTQDGNLHCYVLVIEMCSVLNNCRMKHIIDAIWTRSVAKHSNGRKKVNENNDPNEKKID